MAKRAQPYSLVLRGARKEAARTKYLAFLAGTATRPSRIGLGKARPQSFKLGFDPFSINLPTGILAEASASIDAIKELQIYSEVKKRLRLPAAAPEGSGITIDAVAETSKILKIGGITPARIIKRKYETARGTKKTSEITGLDYGYRKSESFSIPFGLELGATPAQQTISVAFAAARAQIDTANGLTKAFLQDEIA